MMIKLLKNGIVKYITDNSIRISMVINRIHYLFTVLGFLLEIVLWTYHSAFSSTFIFTSRYILIGSLIELIFYIFIWNMIFLFTFLIMRKKAKNSIIFVLFFLPYF
jgi:hypothetical protein